MDHITYSLGILSWEDSKETNERELEWKIVQQHNFKIILTESVFSHNIQTIPRERETCRRDSGMYVPVGLPGFTTVTSFGTGLLSVNILSNQSENQENSNKQINLKP